MKTINNIIKVSLSYTELMNCFSVDTNRCGYLTKADALNNGFSESDWNKYISRAQKLKKTIIKKGFSKASFFILAKDNENNIYLLDGQGRRKAIHLMNEEGYDVSSWIFVCDLYIEPMSKEEMSKLIIDLNTGSTNWQTKDIRRSNALSTDDEDIKEAYKYTKKLSDKYEINDYIVNLFTFGEKASHQRNGCYEAFSTKNYAITKDVFTESYIKFIVNASYKKDKDGNDVERTKEVRKKIRNTNFAISFNSCLRNIVKYHNNNVDQAKEDIMYFTDRLIEACKGDDEYVKQFVKCDKKDKEIVANKIRQFCRKRTICDALYKNIA